MLTDEQLAAAGQAGKKLEHGIRSTLPTLGKAMREMEKMERQFREMRASVRKEMERGARRTTGDPV